MGETTSEGLREARLRLGQGHVLQAGATLRYAMPRYGMRYRLRCALPCDAMPSYAAGGGDARDAHGQAWDQPGDGQAASSNLPLRAIEHDAEMSLHATGTAKMGVEGARSLVASATQLVTSRSIASYTMGL